MKYFLKREQLILELKDSFSIELASFPDYLREELISLLAFSIIEVDKNISVLDDFNAAIQHITNQQGLMSYCTLSEQQQLCVNIFAQQTIPIQEHIVFHKKNLLDTLRIYDAQTSSTETKDSQGIRSYTNDFTSGFVSLFDFLKSLVARLVSVKPGGTHD